MKQKIRDAIAISLMFSIIFCYCMIIVAVITAIILLPILFIVSFISNNVMSVLFTNVPYRQILFVEAICVALLMVKAFRHIDE